MNFNDYHEFITANCVECPVRAEKGCKTVDPFTCQRAVDLVNAQNNKGYQVVVGNFMLMPKVSQMRAKCVKPDPLERLEMGKEYECVRQYNKVRIAGVGIVVNIDMFLELFKVVEEGGEQ